MSQNRLPGIANPQNTKRLGHFLTTDCKSVETPNGKNELYCGCGCFRIKAPTSIVLTVPSLKCNSTFNGATYFAETTSIATSLFQPISPAKIGFYFESAKKMGENFLEIPTQYRLFGITCHPSKLFFPLTPLGEEVERIVVSSAIFCYFAVE